MQKWHRLNFVNVVRLWQVEEPDYRWLMGAEGKRKRLGEDGRRHGTVQVRVACVARLPNQQIVPVVNGALVIRQRVYTWDRPPSVHDTMHEYIQTDGAAIVGCLAELIDIMNNKPFRCIHDSHAVGLAIQYDSSSHASLNSNICGRRRRCGVHLPPDKRFTSKLHYVHLYSFLRCIYLYTIPHKNKSNAALTTGYRPDMLICIINAS